MNEIIKKQYALINILDSAVKEAITAAYEYNARLSPDIFGFQKANADDEEHYFELHRKITSVSHIFSETAVKLYRLEEEAREISVEKELIERIHKASLLCSAAEEQCFSPYLRGIYKALKLDAIERKNIDAGDIRRLTHAFSINLNEFINNLIQNA
jgi:hypothetical protein